MRALLLRSGTGPGLICKGGLVSPVTKAEQESGAGTS